MAITYPCFTCGSPDHIKADCPNRTRRGESPPAPRLEPGTEDERQTVASPHCLKCGVDLRYATDHAPGCGQAPPTPERIGAILAAAGIDRSGVVRTGYRDANRMMPRTEAQLRELAARQAAESRAIPRPFDGKERAEEQGAA